MRSLYISLKYGIGCLAFSTRINKAKQVVFWFFFAPNELTDDIVSKQQIRNQLYSFILKATPGSAMHSVGADFMRFPAGSCTFPRSGRKRTTAAHARQLSVRREELFFGRGGRLINNTQGKEHPLCLQISVVELPSGRSAPRQPVSGS